jgi:crossover junction endodeoxyribonuclease RuvC
VSGLFGESEGGDVSGFIGIDPGKDGAVALIRDGVPTVMLWDTPTVNVGRKSRRDYDEVGMIGILRVAREIVGAQDLHVALELVHAMPGQGVTSMFSMGEGYGLWRGILAAIGLRREVVTPQRWKGMLMHGQPKEKTASVMVAGRLFPQAAAQLRGPRGGYEHNRADALLIAEWLRRAQGAPF